MDEYCRKCGKELAHDEIALYRKIYNRGAKDFLVVAFPKDWHKRLT